MTFSSDKHYLAENGLSPTKKKIVDCSNLKDCYHKAINIQKVSFYLILILSNLIT